jgi:hypothetical protein
MERDIAREAQMPLHRGSGTPVVTRDLNVDFVMIDEIGRTVPCTITRAAIEYLSRPHSVRQFERLDAYVTWQDSIEHAANDKYDAYRFVDGRIMITVGDVAHMLTLRPS